MSYTYWIHYIAVIKVNAHQRTCYDTTLSSFHAAIILFPQIEYDRQTYTWEVIFVLLSDLTSNTEDGHNNHKKRVLLVFLFF